jgi:hypothetical protein
MRCDRKDSADLGEGRLTIPGSIVIGTTLGAPRNIFYSTLIFKVFSFSRITKTYFTISPYICSMVLFYHPFSLDDDNSSDGWGFDR